MTTANWPTARLDTVGRVVTGSTPPTSDKSNYGQQHLFAGPADLGHGKYVRSTAKRLSAKGFERSRHVPAGSTLFVCIGSVGKIGLAGEVLATNQQINSIIPSSNVDPEFLYYATSTLSGLVREQASEQVLPLVNKSQFSGFEIPLPPLAEQRVIATALGDADDLIVTLERVIVKKQAIKQGMMQQLLTGRTRLPGFDREWTPMPLSDLLTYEQPGRYLVSTANYVESGVPVLTAGKTFLLGHTSERYGVYDQLPVIIFDDFTTASKFVDFPFKAKSSAMKMLSARPIANLKFVYERMQLIDFIVVDHKRRWIAEYSKQEVTVPGIQEQNAIAQILIDIDREIEIWRGRLSKACVIKTGMAQQLLTGRTRLPVESVS